MITDVINCFLTISADLEFFNFDNIAKSRNENMINNRSGTINTRSRRAVNRIL